MGVLDEFVITVFLALVLLGIIEMLADKGSRMIILIIIFWGIVYYIGFRVLKWVIRAIFR